MKNSIEIVGITRKPMMYHTDTYGDVTITSYYAMRANGKRVVRGTLADGRECMVALDGRRALEEMIKQSNVDYEAAFLARVPGIDELLTAINDAQDYREAFEGMMEDEGNDGVRPPARPTISVDEARKLYPVAAAYLTILRMSESDPSSQIGYTRRRAGKKAIERIEAGEDIITICNEMMAAIEAEPVTDNS